MVFFKFSVPTEIFFGVGQLNNVGEIVKRYGKKVLIVTDKIIRELDYLDTLISNLNKEGFIVTYFSDASGEPSSQHIDSFCKGIMDLPEVVIGLGGGSCIDFAKGVAVKLTHKNSLWEYVNRTDFIHLMPTERTLPVVAIPTTSGTGSEVTPYCVIKNDISHQKATIISNYIVPKTAIVDPELTKTMPSDLTALTGLDAFAHAFESLINVKSNYMTQMFSIEAINYILNYLPLAIRDGTNLDARIYMSYSSLLAGMSISHVGTTVAHAMAQVLGSRCSLSHGKTVALCLLPVIRDIKGEEVEKKIYELGRRILHSSESVDNEKVVTKTISKLKGFLVDLNSYYRGNIIVNESTINIMTEDVFSYMKRPLDNHPGILNKKAIHNYFNEIVRGDNNVK